MIQDARGDALQNVIEQLRNSPDDPEAWRQAYLSLWPYVMAVNYRLLGGHPEYAEEASQEVFFRLFRYGKLGSLRTAGAARAYVRTICRNVIRSYLTQSGIEKHVSESFDEARHEGASRRALSDEEAVAKDLQAFLLSPLGASDRRLLELTLAGYELREISEKLGVSYSTAAVRLHRLRGKLRKLLQLKDVRDTA